MTLTEFILLSLATFRLGRFIVLDSLIEGTRDRVHFWLMSREGNVAGFLAGKLSELLSCAWCATFWVAGVVIAAWGVFLTPGWPGWWFIIYWWAAAAAAVVVWTYTDPE